MTALRVSFAASPGQGSNTLVVDTGAGHGPTMVDGHPVAAELRWKDGHHARLELEEIPDADAPSSATGTQREWAVIVGPAAPGPDDGSGRIRREVLVDGWRFELEVEPDARARLRERAARGGAAAGKGGPTDVRAIIPGRVLSVEVAAGDAVTLDQRVMVIEAMKMQNELRAPRAGTVARVRASVGQTIEAGDLLLVLE